MVKRDKLYTVNKWNKPLFMEETEPLLTGKRRNVFAGGGQSGWAAIGQNAPTFAEGVGAAFQEKPQYSSAANNGFSMVDSTLAGGRKSQVGMGGVNTGAALMNTGLQSNNPALMLAGGIAGTLGTIINAGWGIKENEANINAVNNSIEQKRKLSRAMNNVFNNKDLLGASGMMTQSTGLKAGDLYEGGWFSGDEAEEKGNALVQKERNALETQNNALLASAGRVDQRNDDAMRRGYTFDFGGNLWGKPIGAGYNRPMIIDNNRMGAIEYGFMSDYLTNKKQQTEQKNQMNNMFAGMPNSMFANGGTILVGKPQDTLFAFGGDMQSNYGDFSTGLTHVDAGGSHEENPNDGVQMGVDNQNVPNLVEEGETVWNDYVFSNRITCDETTKKMFHLPKKKDITYAEVSKKLEKEIQERPNDPISKAGFNAQMEKLEEQQERQKQEMEAEKAKAAFEALSPEEQTAVMQQVAQQEAARENLAAQAEPTGETVGTVVEQPMMAKGGHLFVEGGDSRRIYAPGEYNGNEDTLIDPVSVGTEEDGTLSIIGRKKPVPVEITNTLSPLELMTMMRQENDKAKVNEYLDKVIDKLRKDKSSKGQIHYYPDGGELEGRDMKWYNSLDEHPYIKFVADLFGLKNADEYRANKYFDELATEYAVSNQTPDTFWKHGGDNKGTLYDMAIRLGWGDRMSNSLTPEEWKTLYNEYMKYLDSDEWYNKEATKETKWLADTLGIKTRREYDDIADYLPDYEDIYHGLGTDDTLYNYISDKDVTDIIKQLGYTKQLAKNYTPEQLRNIFEDYIESAKQFKSEFPLYDYRHRRDIKDNKEAANWQRQLIEQRRKREGKAPDTVAEQADNDEVSYPVGRPDENYTSIKRDKNGLTDFDNSTFSIPEFGITVKRPTEPTIKSAKERGINYQPDVQSGTIVSERRVNPVDSIGINPSYSEMHRKGVISNPSTASIQRDPDTAVSAVAPIELTHPSTSVNPVEETIPAHRAGWLRYAGLFGPAAGLGMMAAGIGKPDYSGLDAAVEQANKAPVLAQWKPIGNYLSYRPMDIWYAQNRMDANARATDRAIANSASPAKIAGLLANGYNSQLGAGELFRQALDYNNNLRERTATFNRGTDQYNSQAYNQNQQFNANALNQNTQFGAQMRMNAAQQKMDADAGWYNSLYGNVSGLFKGIGDLGRENEQYNWLSDLAADGYFGQLGTSNTSKRHLKTGRAKGGKIRRKRGLTY